MSRLAGHLQSKRNWPTWASSVLINHPILRNWPPRTNACSLDWRNNWKLAIFLPTHSSFPSRGLCWTDKFLIFWVFLQNLEQSAKKCTELSVEYVEQIPSLFAVDFFLHWSGYWFISTPSISKVVGKIYWTLCKSELCFIKCFPVWFKVSPSNSRGGSWKTHDIKLYKLIRKYFKNIILESVYEDIVHLLHSNSVRINLFNTFP